jgi:hypothetical protein
MSNKVKTASDQDGLFVIAIAVIVSILYTVVRVFFEH